MNDILFKAENISVSRSNVSLLDKISFTLYQQDHLAITGASGSGKTLLAMVVARKIFCSGTLTWTEAHSHKVAWIEQQHQFKNRFNTSDLYYQQRFNSYDSEETLTVEQSFGIASEVVENALAKMKIGYLRSKPLIQLSNGENKKLQIAKALLTQPSVLIMDQPFTGLDAGARNDLHELVNELAAQSITIILITSPDEIPVCITKVLILKKGKLQRIESRQAFLQHQTESRKAQTKWLVDETELRKLVSAPTANFNYAIRMKNVNVKYGDNQILRNISWNVKSGERWLLTGPNGAGKSTLLSLVTADNPQGYANEVYLFDKKRGSGESIWDIKKRIGFLSPELHVFFDKNCTCFEAVASGLFDTIGLFRQLSEAEINLVDSWLQIAGIIMLRQRRLAELSLGEQRIVLLVRALVKNPPLLVLDEPCQGIDNERQEQLLELINSVCLLGNKTLVFVSHYSNNRPACIDRFIQVEQGEIIQNQLL